VHSQDQLQQSGPELVCLGPQASDGINYYFIHWMKQRHGQVLEWIGRIEPENGNTKYNQKFQGKATLTADTSSSTAFMDLRSLTSEDSAVYFCARHSYAEGIWPWAVSALPGSHTDLLFLWVLTEHF
ncbi:hypothetical protein U0070_002739, partial [Myodes glareolus]